MSVSAGSVRCPGRNVSPTSWPACMPRCHRPPGVCAGLVIRTRRFPGSRCLGRATLCWRWPLRRGVRACDLRLAAPSCGRTSPFQRRGSGGRGALGGEFRGALRRPDCCGPDSVLLSRCRSPTSALIRGTSISMRERHVVKAEVTQQRLLLELAELDGELSRLSHRRQSSGAAAVRRAEGEPRRGQRSAGCAGYRSSRTSGRSITFRVGYRGCSAAGRKGPGSAGVRHRESQAARGIAAWVDTLVRRRGDLEDSLLEVMERSEQLSDDQAAELKTIDSLQGRVGCGAEALRCRHG